MKNSMSEQLPYGITCIDTGLVRPGLASCYLVAEDDKLAVIETGTRHTVPRVLEVIKAQGFAAEQVQWVIVTHVHLDHAGGAGALLQELPNAKLVVHPRGARHMIDPSKLQAGTVAVYGEAVYQKIYGDLVPVDEDRVVIANDGDELFLSKRPLLFLDTPGHAKHHFCVYDARSEGIFSGDTLGLVYRELCEDIENFVIPSTTPVQFDPEALKQSLQKILVLNPLRAFLTHYSMVENIPAHAKKLLRAVDRYVEIAKSFQSLDSEQRLNKIEQALLEYSLDELYSLGSALDRDRATELLQLDMGLNAQGLNVWLAQTAV